MSVLSFSHKHPSDSRCAAERRPQLQRVPVLHHHGAHAVPRRQTRRVWQGRRWHRRRPEDGAHQDGVQGQGRAEHGRGDCTVWRDVRVAGLGTIGAVYHPLQCVIFFQFGQKVLVEQSLRLGSLAGK